MNNIQTYETKAEANRARIAMRGWRTHIQLLSLPVGEDDAEGQPTEREVWTIQCRPLGAHAHCDPLYLRADGIVR